MGDKVKKLAKKSSPETEMDAKKLSLPGILHQLGWMKTYKYWGKKKHLPRNGFHSTVCSRWYMQRFFSFFYRGRGARLDPRSAREPATCSGLAAWPRVRLPAIAAPCGTVALKVVGPLTWQRLPGPA